MIRIRSVIQTRPRGRPRSEETSAAILDTTITLLREVGYDALTIEAVATRAAVGKAAVYRRWRNREALAVEAIQRIVTELPEPDTGTLRGDVMALMRGTLAMYRDPATAALLTGLVAAMARSAPIAEAVREGFLAVRREAFRRVLRRGITRGELPRRTDVELTIDLLSGPLFYRSLLTGAPIDERLARAIVKKVLP